mgnify:CR=1 FL=1
MAKHNLIHLMNHSYLTVCNGYEIDNFWPDYSGISEFPNQCRLMCGDDDIVFLPNDQEIEINEKLEVLPIEQDGDLYYFEFKILTPLNPDHLPRSFKS